LHRRRWRCGLAGAFCYLLLAAAHVLIADPDVPLVGASAGIFGLLVAAPFLGGMGMYSCPCQGRAESARA
jgi:membrane associated rhomboid family serine protease